MSMSPTAKELMECVTEDDLSSLRALLENTDRLLLTPQASTKLLRTMLTRDNVAVAELLLPRLDLKAQKGLNLSIRSYEMLKLLLRCGLNVGELLQLGSTSAQITFLTNLNSLLMQEIYPSALTYFFRHVDQEPFEKLLPLIGGEREFFCALTVLSYDMFRQYGAKLADLSTYNFYLSVGRELFYFAGELEAELHEYLEDPDPKLHAALHEMLHDYLMWDKFDLIKKQISLLGFKPELQQQLLNEGLFMSYSVKAFETLLDLGADVKAVNSRGHSPLYYLPDRLRTKRERKYVEDLFFSRAQKLSPKSHRRGQRFTTLLLKLADLSPADQEGRFAIKYDNRAYLASQSFISSMNKAFDFSPNFFNYFTPEEIFARLTEKYSNKLYYLTFDEKDQVALSIISNGASFLPAETTIRAIESSPLYISSTFRSGMYYAEILQNNEDNLFTFNGVDFEGRLLICYAVDGSRRTTVYPGFACSERSYVFYLMHKSFEVELTANREAGHKLEDFLNHHHLQSFSLAVFRLGQAMLTPASVQECMYLSSQLSVVFKDALIVHKLSSAIEQYIGDPCEYYGITSLNVIRENFRHMLPVRCSVMDLVVFLCELQKRSNLKLLECFEIYQYLGRIMSESFNLEHIFPLERSLARLEVLDV